MGRSRSTEWWLWLIVIMLILCVAAYTVRTAFLVKLARQLLLEMESLAPY